MNARLDRSPLRSAPFAWALAILSPLFAIGSGCLASSVDGYATGGSGGAGHTTQNHGGEGGAGAHAGGSGAHQATGTGGGCDGVLCGKSCVDLASDPDHCGSCSEACPGSYGCTKGVCDNKPASVLAGALVSCVILVGGDLYCFGRDVYGEVGIPSAQATYTAPHAGDKAVPTPTKIDLHAPVAEVGSGSEFTCARTRPGDVYCWGSNDKGRLGHDPATDDNCIKAWSPSPPDPQNAPCSAPVKVALPAGVKAVQLAVGVNATCVRTDMDDVYCWGDNSDGAIRAPAGGSSFLPVKNANVAGNALDVAVSGSAEGWDTVCIVRKGTKSVDCWGESVGYFFVKTGGTGCGHSASGCDPVAHTVPLDFASPTQPLTADHLQLGYVTGCAILGGVVSCWGSNEFGQFGNGSWASARRNPTAIPGIPATASQLSMTFATTVVLDTSGDVSALGWNALGQVGTGAATGSVCRDVSIQSTCVETAKQLTTLPKIAQLSGGSQSSAAVTVDHVVYIWGSNIDGEQGHVPGTMADVACAGSFCNYVPQIVPGLP